MNQKFNFIPNIWITGEIDGLKIVGRTFENFGFELVACLSEKAEIYIVPIDEILNIRNLTFIKPENDVNTFFSEKTYKPKTSIISEENYNKVLNYIESRFNEYISKIGDKPISLRIDKERVRKVHSYQEAKQILGQFNPYFFISLN
ncbi:hypothetical protein M0Q97_10705 [Candidatus Dojkabacteria bacterium]|jgi:hypothetical protein|nr:hypothetical protein [Candidatus Dojkabacteria bacterium]